MKEITFHCETITPMFLAGADGKTPELRAASIKGALRFWWRALNGDKSIDELKDKEAKIFGNTKRRSSFSINITNKKIIEKGFNLDGENKVTVKFKVKKKGIETERQIPVGILKYLSFGVLDRNYFDHGTEFDLTFQYKDDVEVELFRAISALNSFGGLGSKSRNGLGSFHVTSNKDKLQKIEVNGFKSKKKEYCTINKDSKFKQLASGDSPLQVLEQIGLKYFNSKEGCMNTNLIASSGINWLDLKRYPKQYFFSVKKDNDNYVGRVLFLPVLLPPNKKGKPTDPQYIKQHKEFQEKLFK